MQLIFLRISWIKHLKNNSCNNEIDIVYNIEETYIQRDNGKIVSKRKKKY